MKYIVQAIDIKKCFLLTGERGVGQVLGGRRRAHRPGRVRRRRPSARRYALARSRRRARGGSGAAVIQPRISRAGAARAPRRRRRRAPRAARRCARRGRSCARNSRKANAVVAKPPGTRMPAPASWLIISPSDAFLPPTSLDVGHSQALERDDPCLVAHSLLNPRCDARAAARKARREDCDSTAAGAARRAMRCARKNDEPAAAGSCEERAASADPRQANDRPSARRRDRHRRQRTVRCGSAASPSVGVVERPAARRRLRLRPFTARRSVRYRSGCDSLR